MSAWAARKPAASMPAHRHGDARPPARAAEDGDLGRRQSRPRGAQADADHRSSGGASASFRCARRATPFWSASAPCCRTIRSSPAACRALWSAHRCAWCSTPNYARRWPPRCWPPCARRRHGSSASRKASRDRRRDSAAARLQGVPRRRRQRQLDLDGVLKVLAGEGITRLMVEGGPTVAASFDCRRSGGRGRRSSILTK